MIRRVLEYMMHHIIELSIWKGFLERSTELSYAVSLLRAATKMYIMYNGLMANVIIGTLMFGKNISMK